MRLALAAATTAALLAAPCLAPPASAATGALVARCTVVYGGSAPCVVTGVVGGRVVNGNATLNATSDFGCPAGTGGGTIVGVINEILAWIRRGPGAAVTGTAEVNGAGVAMFSAACPTQGETVVVTIAGT